MDELSFLHAVSTYGRSGGSSRVRMFQWLEETGVPSVIHDYIGLQDVRPRTILRHPARTLASEARQFRVARLGVHRLLLQRDASPFSRGALEERLLGSARIGIYDFDDALQWDPRAGLVGALRNYQQKTIRCIRAADRVIAGNEILADFASSFSKHIVVIPSCVSPARYAVKETFEVHDPPIVGWIGTTGGEAYLAGITAALLELNRRTGARLQVVSGRGLPLGKLEGIVDRHIWTESLSEEILATWDVGIMPLPDSPYERGKCGYKLLQYAASGLPAVASPVGINETICRDFKFLSATSIDEWIDALTLILEASSELREKISKVAQAEVNRSYSYEAWKNRWLNAVGETLSTSY